MHSCGRSRLPPHQEEPVCSCCVCMARRKLLMHSRGKPTWLCFPRSRGKLDCSCCACGQREAGLSVLCTQPEGSQFAHAACAAKKALVYPYCTYSQKRGYKRKPTCLYGRGESGCFVPPMQLGEVRLPTWLVGVGQIVEIPAGCVLQGSAAYGVWSLLLSRSWTAPH